MSPQAVVQQRAMKIMQKNYHLINRSTGEKLVVFPPRLPGLNKDFMDPKNEHGEWVRVFTVVEGGGRSFRKGKEIVLTHAPGEVPHCTLDGTLWEIEPIPGVSAVKKRGAERKGYQGVVTMDKAQPKRGPGRPRKVQAVADGQPKRRGRPPGSKNKSTLLKEQQAQAQAAGQPKRRGRPPGSKNKPKTGEVALITGRRGRPKGSKNAATILREKRLAALEKARAVRMKKLRAAKKEAAAKEPETVQA